MPVRGTLCLSVRMEKSRAKAAKLSCSRAPLLSSHLTLPSPARGYTVALAGRAGAGAGAGIDVLPNKFAIFDVKLAELIVAADTKRARPAPHQGWVTVSFTSGTLQQSALAAVRTDSYRCVSAITMWSAPVCNTPALVP